MTTQMKLRKIFQLIFNPYFSPKIKVRSIFERDSVHEVVNCDIKWRCLLSFEQEIWMWETSPSNWLG